MADTVNFWNLFHSLLRKDSSSEESERVKANLRWVSDNMVQIRAICMPEYELPLMQLIWNFWTAHREAPSYKMIEDMVLKMDKSEGLQDALSEYQTLKSASELRRFDAQDLYQVLRDKTDEFENWKLNAVIETTKKIANGAIEEPKTKKKLAGNKDALVYLLGQLQNGILTSQQKSVGGNLRAISSELRDDYNLAKRENLKGSLTMKTGIAAIDQVIGGFKRGNFWGVLGYAGQRKSSLCRTIAYNISNQGFQVMHIPLEQSCEEERNIYAVIHSHHEKFKKFGFNISINDLEDGNLTPAQEDFLFDVVVPDLPDNIIIRQPSESTWEGVQAQVELQQQIAPVDLLLIDYFTLLDTSYSKGQDRQVMNSLIKNAKSWCLNFGNKRKICMLTPVQGNRDGYAEAQKHEGKWDMEGVYEYSEFDKSLDGCMFTFSDSDLEAQQKIKLGTCKNRRRSNVPPFMISVSSESGLVDAGIAVSVAGMDKTLNEVIDPYLL
jgi:replicative DNA helicase